MGVDVMEVGFPVSCRVILNQCKPSLARLKTAAYRVSSLRGERYRRGGRIPESREAFRIHTFIATSPMHIATKRAARWTR